MSHYLKNPDALMNYAIDWAPGYLDGQIIAASSWSVDPQETGGVAIDSARFDATRTATVLSGGIAGKVYRVTNAVTLADGRADTRMLVVRVERH